MCRTLKDIFFGLGLLFSAALTGAELKAQLLVYRVAEPGNQPYISRLLVTPEYLRLDQGQQDPGFILLDRKARIIFSVNSEERRILVIEPPRQERKLPSSLRLSENRQLEADMPQVAGKTPEYWQFLVNARLCRSAVVVPGLLPQANAAYAEYLDLLAYQQQETQAAMPAELQDPCETAIHVYAPLAVLDKGLPLREWHESGWRQELLDFQYEFNISSDSFELPADYQKVPLGKM